MICTRQGSLVFIRILSKDTNAFRKQWPCCSIPEDASFLIELDSRNGDLVNITAWQDDTGINGNGGMLDTEAFDGDALLALCNDANNWAVASGILPQWAKR